MKLTIHENKEQMLGALGITPERLVQLSDFFNKMVEDLDDLVEMMDHITTNLEVDNEAALVLTWLGQYIFQVQLVRETEELNYKIMLDKSKDSDSVRKLEA